MRLYFIPVLLLLIAASSFAQTATNVGSITGKVLDEAGRPIRGAKVYEEFEGVLLRKSLVSFADTNADGSFAINHLEFGTYKLYGMKEEDGYPPSYWWFYADSSPAVTADISLQKRVANVILKLGPRAGILTGTVKDAVSGKPLTSGFILRSAANPKKYLSTSTLPQFRVLIPSLTEVAIEVSAPAYQTWVYADRLNPSEPSSLRLEPGAEMQMDIFLQPKVGGNVSMFLIPEGYVGWLRVECNDLKPPLVATVGGVTTYKFNGGGVLKTSSPMPERDSRKEYRFYSTDGSTRPAPDYWDGGGLIWAEYEGMVRGGTRSFFGFFVGTHEQYEKARGPSLD